MSVASTSEFGEVAAPEIAEAFGRRIQSAPRALITKEQESFISLSRIYVSENEDSVASVRKSESVDVRTTSRTLVEKCLQSQIFVELIRR